MTKRFVLSIDGGGVRGGISTSFLQKLETHIFQPFGATIQSATSALGGTSAGSLIAAMLAVGVPVSKLNTEFFCASELAHTFSYTTLGSLPLIGRVFQQYDNDSKLKQIERFLGNHNVTLNDLSPRILLNTYNWTRQSVNLFHNFHPVGLPQARVADVIHASSCPPYYFAPHQIPIPLHSKTEHPDKDWWTRYSDRVSGLHGAKDNDYHCDGGLACNTSDLTLYGLAKDYWPGDEIFMLSLGTGFSHADEYVHSPFSSSLFGISRTNMMDSLIKAPNECRSLECCLLIDADHYIRIDHPLPQGISDSIDEHDQPHIDALRLLGEDWFDKDVARLKNFFRNFFEPS